MTRYEARNLEDIAELFDRKAVHERVSAANAKTKTAADMHSAYAGAYREAALILRQTELVPDRNDDERGAT